MAVSGCADGSPSIAVNTHAGVECVPTRSQQLGLIILLMALTLYVFLKLV